MRHLFGCPDIVSLTEKFLMARNFYWIFTEYNPVMGDSKTFCIPKAKGLSSSESIGNLSNWLCCNGGGEHVVTFHWSLGSVYKIVSTYMYYIWHMTECVAFLLWFSQSTGAYCPVLFVQEKVSHWPELGQ